MIDQPIFSMASPNASVGAVPVQYDQSSLLASTPVTYVDQPLVQDVTQPLVQDVVQEVVQPTVSVIPQPLAVSMPVQQPMPQIFDEDYRRGRPIYDDFRPDNGRAMPNPYVTPLAGSSINPLVASGATPLVASAVNPVAASVVTPGLAGSVVWAI